MKRTVGLLLLMLWATQAWSAECQRDIQVVELTPDAEGRRGYDMVVNGRAIGTEDPLHAFSRTCARKLVALVHPDITFRQLADLHFFAGKVGTRLNGQNFHLFVFSPDRTRMTYIPGSGTIKYTNDADRLLGIIASPPETDDFLN
ncbi:MAG TPA: hypothetical protein VGE88_07180 [Lysobacter sp.]